MGHRFAAPLIAACLLVACGGGGGDAGSTPPVPTVIPEGLWIGSTSTNRTITGLVLDDGTYYLFYSPAGNANLIAGVVQGTGTGTGQNGFFSSSNARDFNIEAPPSVLSATIQGNFTLRVTLNGTVDYGTNGSVAFATSFNPAYDLIPSLGTLAGTYTGQVASTAGVETATLTITASGAFSGVSSGGCNFSGSAAPRSRGNVYDITVLFGQPPCVHVAQSFSGIGYFDALTKRLSAAAPNSARTIGVLFVGTKP
jgi:hypothetical protein